MRDYYDVVVKGYNIKYDSDAFVKYFNNGQDVCKMNAKEFIIEFYQFLEAYGGPVYLNHIQLKGFKFNKKDMTLYLTIN